QLRGLTPKDGVVNGLAAVLRQKERSSHRRHEGRGQHSEPEHGPDGSLDLGVVPADHQIVPWMARYTISMASATMTTLNTRRRCLGCVRVRIRAPRRAPASTPSMTGKESTGSM